MTMKFGGDNMHKRTHTHTHELHTTHTHTQVNYTQCYDVEGALELSLEQALQSYFRNILSKLSLKISWLVTLFLADM